MMLFDILLWLDKRNVHYVLRRERNDSVMIAVTLAGLRIEIDVFEDEHIEYSVFSGDEWVLSELPALEKLIESKL